MLTALFVTSRIIANPVSNVLQKQLVQHSANPVVIIGVTHALLTLAILPLVLGTVNSTLGADFWFNIVLCALLAVSSNVLLVYALKTGDLSVLGPVNAYKAVISLVLGVFVIGEIPTIYGFVGMLLILVGSSLIITREPDQSRHNALMKFFRERGIQLRLAALVLSATEAVFLKRTLLLTSPLTTFIWWSILGLPIAATALLLRSRSEISGELVLIQRHWRTYLGLAITTGVMQLATLMAFGRMAVGYSLALFQLSSLITVFLGYRYFQERDLRRRLMAAVVMMSGAVLIAIFGKSSS